MKCACGRRAECVGFVDVNDRPANGEVVVLTAGEYRAEDLPPVCEVYLSCRTCEVGWMELAGPLLTELLVTTEQPDPSPISLEEYIEFGRLFDALCPSES